MTQTAKHTPGPWIVNADGAIEGYDGRIICLIVQGWELKVAQFPNPCTEEESRAANAALIATAPKTAAERDELKIIANGNYQQFMEACAEVRKQKAIAADLLAALEGMVDALSIPVSRKQAYKIARTVIAKAKGE